jgi:Zn-dependent protease
MGRSIRIGSAFGIGLYLHWSFLLILGLMFFLKLGGGVVAALVGTALVVSLFGCVVLHELGHALMARKFGIGTRDITLYPIGGVARLERMSDDPGEEIAIAVAGPAVNVVIAAGLWFGMSLAGLSPWEALSNPQEIGQYGSVAELGMLAMLKVNVMLVLFNLIPAFPMDGGRVFRAVLASFFGRMRATELAVGVAKALAFAFILCGVIGRIPWTQVTVSPFLAIIGFFVLVAGQQELAMLRYQDYARRRGVPETPVSPQEPVTVLPVEHLGPSAYPAQPGFSGFTWDRRHGVWIEWRDGRPVGACSVGRTGPAW